VATTIRPPATARQNQQIVLPYACQITQYGAIALAAGVINLMSFMLITLGLKLTTLVRINAINSVLTTALTAVAEILLFAEPATAAVMIGIVLTIAGIILVGVSDESSERIAG
jgi:drug/metabolite transporter (DMT)-like permease